MRSHWKDKLNVDKDGENKETDNGVKPWSDEFALRLSSSINLEDDPVTYLSYDMSNYFRTSDGEPLDPPYASSTVPKSP